MTIPFFRSNFDKRELKAVSQVVKSGWLTMGRKTLEFEKRFADYINAPYCIAVNSATSALFLCLKYLRKTRPEIKTITVPSITFTATAAACLHAGYKIKFGEIEPITFNLKKTNSPSIPVHLAGLYCHQENPVIEDSAHRILPKSFTGTPTCFSFYMTKNLATGEGGMIAVKSKKMADWLRKARLHGLNLDAWKRYSKKGSAKYVIEFPGWKMNITDLQSALGLVQLKKLPNLNEQRQKLVARYNQHLNDIDREANHLYLILVNKRDDFTRFMQSKKIQTSIHFHPLHLQPAYKEYYRPLPISEFVGKNIISLPLFPGLKPDEVDYVARQVLFWWNKYGKPKYNQR